MHHNIYFLEGLPAEDTFFSNLLLLKAKKGYYLEKAIVLYRVRNKGDISISNNLTEKYFTLITEANRQLLNICQKYGNDEFLVASCFENFSYVIANLIFTTQVPINQKGKILFGMKELLNSLPLHEWNPHLLKDQYGFTRVYCLNTKEEYHKYIIEMDHLPKIMSRDEFKVVQKSITDQLMKQFEK